MNDAEVPTPLGAPTVLALDLSLTATGWAYAAEVGVIETTPALPVEARLIHLRDVIAEMLPVDLVIIEDYVTKSPAASTLGMVHGVVRTMLVDHDQTFVLIAPSALKKYATGKGQCSKPDVRMGVYKRFDRDIADDNACDAFVLRAMALDAYGHPLAALPQTHRQALEAIVWPQLTAAIA